jgi:hypothetical protein
MGCRDSRDIVTRRCAARRGCRSTAAQRRGVAAPKPRRDAAARSCSAAVGREPGWIRRTFRPRGVAGCGYQRLALRSRPADGGAPGVGRTSQRVAMSDVLRTRNRRDRGRVFSARWSAALPRSWRGLRDSALLHPATPCCFPAVFAPLFFAAMATSCVSVVQGADLAGQRWRAVQPA